MKTTDSSSTCLVSPEELRVFCFVSVVFRIWLHDVVPVDPNTLFLLVNGYLSALN